MLFQGKAYKVSQAQALEDEPGSTNYVFQPEVSEDILSDRAAHLEVIRQVTEMKTCIQNKDMHACAHYGFDTKLAHIHNTHMLVQKPGLLRLQSGCCLCTSQTSCADAIASGKSCLRIVPCKTLLLQGVAKPLCIARQHPWPKCSK